MFIVIEGSDGCGKSTQAEMLQAKFKEYALPVVGFSFPRYDTDIGKAISRHLKGEWRAASRSPDGELGRSMPTWETASEDPLVFQALQCMDKLEAATAVAWQLSVKTHVVACRWWQSAVVYGAALGFEAKRMVALHSLLPCAHLNVLLTVSEDVTLARRPDLRDYLEQNRHLQRGVRAGYRELWRQKKLSFVPESSPTDPKWVEIDGDVSAEEVHRQVWQHVMRLFSDHCSL